MPVVARQGLRGAAGYAPRPPSTPGGGRGGAAPCPGAPALVLPPDVPADAGRMPVCGVVAVAVAAGVSFATAWGLLGQLHDADVRGFRDKGNRRRVWRGETTFTDRACALFSLGVRWRHELMNVPTKFFVWDRDVARPGVTYVVSLGRHVVVYRDGLTLDQNGVVDAQVHWARHRLVADVLLLREPLK